MIWGDSMFLEIKSILKSKISMIVFLVLLVLNMIQVPNYMGDSYNVEQNMGLFESQIDLAQETYSQIKMQYNAQKNISDADKVYWESYLEYLNWSIQNAKEGWNLFNTYGNDVLTNEKLYRKYSQITLWDKVYHLDSLKKNGGKEFIEKIQSLNFKEPDIHFDKTKIYMIGSQLSVDKKGDFREKKLSIQEQLHDLQFAGNTNKGKGPWAFLIHQLRINSKFTFVCMPLCIVFCIVIIWEQKKNGSLELSRLSNKHWFNSVYLNLIFSFFILSFVSLFIPIVLLTISNGLSGLSDWILIDSKSLISLSLYEHGDNYILNNLSEYYLTTSGFTPNLTYVELWKVLLLACPLMIMKIVLFVSIGVFSSVLFSKSWESYLTGVLWIGLNYLSQNESLLSIINPLSVLSSVSVVCGNGQNSYFNAALILIVATLLLLVINYFIVKRKDYD